MATLPVDVRAVVNALKSHAAESGHIERVFGYEPKSNPGNGVSAAVWLQRVQPVPRDSGLSVTTIVLNFMVRLMTPMLQEPEDEIDPAIYDAMSALMIAYSGQFQLGGYVDYVDLLGRSGFALGAIAGYLNHSRTMYRVMDITVPCIIENAWTQAA